MKATSCTRTGCTIGHKQITYDALSRYYVCDECGGRPIHRIVRDGDQTVDCVACGACGCEELVSERRYLEQIAEGWEVEAGLPEPLRVLIKKGEPRCQSATEAVAALYG